MADVDSATISVLCSGPGSIPLFSKLKVNILALTAGNIAGQQTKVSALGSATQALTNGTVAETSVAITSVISRAYPTAPANRGEKWIVSASDAAGNVFTYTIPAAFWDTGSTPPDLNTDGITANLASPSWAAFATAFNDVATDRFGGTLNVLRAKLGGRRR